MKLLHLALLTATLLGGCFWPVYPVVEYLIPDGFTGPVVLLFDDPLGQQIERTGFRHVEYRIDSQGVLRLREAWPYNWVTARYFYVDVAGHRTALPVSSLRNGPSQSSNQIFGLKYGTRSAKLAVNQGNINQSVDRKFNYQEFFVGRPVDFPDFPAREEELGERVLQADIDKLAAGSPGSR